MANIIAVIFGVLIDARAWHFQALKSHLQNMVSIFNDDYHEARLDGLPTQSKLKILKKGICLERVIVRLNQQA